MILRSLRVLLPDGERPASVHVEDGRIVAIGPYDSEGEGLQDLDDLVLMPGLVDTHVHVNEPGRTEWEGFETATRAAADGQCHVDVGFWGGAVPGNAASLGPLHRAGVFGFKCFLIDSGVPEFPPLSPAELDTALSTVDALFLVHAEDPETVQPAPPTPHYRDFLDSRPAQAEVRAVRTAIEAARRTGARVHILHLSAAEALPILADALDDGVRVTAETCPHYLTLLAETVPDGATAYKCCPPIRDAANRDALWEGLRDGLIECVVSDHSPCTADLKRADTGDFAAAWGGIASLQLGLPLMWTEAEARGVDLGEVVSWMARRPADLAGLVHKGRIAVGADADLVAFDPTTTWVVDPSALHHRNPVTPYAGRPLRGSVRTTWLRGVPVDGSPRGRLLERGAA